MKKKTRINPRERDQIAFKLAKGISISQIAKDLNRSKSSVSDEIKRNSRNGIYVAICAQHKSDNRKRLARYKNRQPLKSKFIYSYTLDKLRYGWSPEQISGRLKKDFNINIHWETIYRFIYDPTNRDKRLWEYLPRKQKKRHKKYGRKVSKERIPNRISIHSRDKTIETRLTYGHWEGDSVIGRQTRGKVIHTEVERKTRFLQARLINNKTSIDTIQAQLDIFTKLPAKTVTLDNGTEFVKHQQLNQLDIQTYFADPYQSGQRGTNENTNGLLRRYLPKKTSFNNLTQEELNDIVWEINNRPRKCLNYSTPYEILQQELKVNSVRLLSRM